MTHRHFREVGFCNRGLRAEALRHGIDWAGFLKSGIDAQALRALGNAMALLTSDEVEIEGSTLDLGRFLRLIDKAPGTFPIVTRE